MSKIVAVLNLITLILYIIFLRLNNKCWKDYKEELKKREQTLLNNILKEYKELENVIEEVYSKSNIPFKERKKVLDKYNDIGKTIEFFRYRLK